MLAFFETKFGAYTIAAVVLISVGFGFWLHLRAESRTIVSLNQQITQLQIQTKSLQAANDSLKTDIDNVQKAQAAADQALNDVRDQAATATKLVRNRTFVNTNPTALQVQVNKETSDMFSRLEALSRGE